MFRALVFGVMLYLGQSRPGKRATPEDRRDRCTAIGIGPKAMNDGSTVTTHSKCFSILRSNVYALYTRLIIASTTFWKTTLISIPLLPLSVLSRQ